MINSKHIDIGIYCFPPIYIYKVQQNHVQLNFKFDSRNDPMWKLNQGESEDMTLDKRFT